ncbi:sensor histidine kinase [Lederbergia ruris]|uniref:Sensor histidine kinase n=1 Tax=Lederbergia ruris TaxID=217495 RepID=A0ABQ4KHI5_9BACI|nr:sensor histidine kinase [Lederbergia ruris]GIN56818.1 sensor histidine kinase [Lederbergia ruris]
MRNSLARQLFFYFLVICVFSLTSVGWFTYEQSSRQLDEQNYKYMEQIINNALNHSDAYLKSYERSIVSLIMNKDIKQFIDQPPLEGYDRYYYRSLMKEHFRPIFIHNPEVISIYIISYNGNAVYDYNNMQGSSFTSAEVAEQLKVLKAQTQNDGKVSIFGKSFLDHSTGPVITLARKIRGLSSTQFEGILAVEMNSAELSNLWKGIELGEEGYFSIVDENGSIIFHPERYKIGTQLDGDLKHRLLRSPEEYFIDKEHRPKRVYMTRRSDYSGWHLIISNSYNMLRAPVSVIRMTTITVGLMTLVLALWISHRFGRSITRPIQTLRKSMQQTESGNWSIIPPSHRKDEIADLTESYNRMVYKLSELIERVYETRLHNQKVLLARQTAEFQALQMQINPHFLYNTLETIVCYAAVKDSPEIEEIIKSLSYMLRYSVQTNLKEVTVEEELEHVLHYSAILKHRFGTDFKIEVAVDEKYLLYKMVRLTLQPLVENVINHAFPNGRNDDHFIRIKTAVEGGIFLVIVEDNGAGIRREQLIKLLSKLQTSSLLDEESLQSQASKGSIGLTNVHKRIRMAYGEQYGLQIHQREGGGTIVCMLMPADPLHTDHSFTTNSP